MWALALANFESTPPQTHIPCMIVVLFVCCPFKVAYRIIKLITIFMIHTGFILWIRYKDCGNKLMNVYDLNTFGNH